MALLNLKMAVLAKYERQWKFAKQLGISNGLLTHLITGSQKPSPGLRERIAKALGADPDWLFSERFKIRPPRIGGE